MRNRKLGALARRLVHQFGYDYSSRYLYPLTFFISATGEETIDDIASRGWSQDAVQSTMREILQEDAHLLKCCGDVYHLARAIDILFFNKLGPWHFNAQSSQPETQPDVLDGALHELDIQLYEQGEFQKYACFHLFNVKFPSEHIIKAPYEGWVLSELKRDEVPRLLGESSVHSFVSPPSTGTWFLMCKDTNGFETERLYEWLTRRWKEAWPFRQVMQYGVDGILDIDYVVPHFSPDWVNLVQKEGMYFLGSPRQDFVPFGLCPQFTIEVQQRINRMWKAYLLYHDRMKATGPSLRKVIRIAGEFFEEYQRKANRAEQFANLMIGLEALFSPGNPVEATFRISQSCALIACAPGDGSGRQEVFEFLTQMFKRRGRLFHGHYDSETESPEKLVSDEEIKKLASLVRRSILRLLAMYVRGENDIENLRKDFQKAALDEVLRNRLLSNGDIETLIDDSQATSIADQAVEPFRQAQDSN